MRMTRILIVDDHPVLRAGLKLMLEGERDLLVVGEAGDGDAALTLAADQQPDVILLDISLPGQSGLAALSSLRRSSPKSRFLVLSMHETEAYLRGSLAGGATGYIPKRAADTELINAIRAVSRGEVYIHSSMTHFLIDDLGAPNGNSGTAAAQGTWTNLSEREREVLLMVAHGLTNAEISRRLCLSVKTIETYRARGLEKLGLKNRAALVNFALANQLLNP